MNAFPPDDVHLDERYLSIYWDREHRCVYAAFKSFATSVEFREGTMKIIEAIRARRAAALISDNRKLEGVSDADQGWIQDTWVPLAEAAGLKRIAVVLAHQGLGKFVSEQIISRFTEKDFVTRTFDTLAAANKWIVSDKS
jgi:hypothetical protein